MASRKLRASALPDCSKTAVGTCLTSVLMAHPKMPSIATGTPSARTSARTSRRRWMNSLTMMPRSREPTLRALERPQLLAQPRLALLVHEGDEEVFNRGLDVLRPAHAEPRALEEGLDVPGAGAGRGQHHPQPRPHPQHLLDRLPVRQEVRGAAQVLHVHLDDWAAERLALD